MRGLAWAVGVVKCDRKSTGDWDCGRKRDERNVTKYHYESIVIS